MRIVFFFFTFTQLVFKKTFIFHFREMLSWAGTIISRERGHVPEINFETQKVTLIEKHIISNVISA